MEENQNLNPTPDEKPTSAGPNKAIIAAIVAIACALIAFAVYSSTSKPEAQAPVEEKTESAQEAKEEETYTVPQVVSLTQPDAEKAILASGLQVGKVTKEHSDTVPTGSVISQDPKALTKAKPNSKVNLVVSSGKADPKDVTVPDLKGKTQSEAKKELKDLGLVAAATNPEETTEVEPGLVFKQSVKAGTTVKEGTKVTFTVALAPSEATVPNVVGMTQDDAKAALAKANLGYDSTTSYSDNVAKDVVISQSVEPGQKIKTGTTVIVCVSLGAKPAQKVIVPDVVGYTWSDAEAAMRSAGLAVRYTGDPAGKVVSQDVAAGSEVDQNTLVTVTLASPVQMVEVPNLIGMSVTSAEIATDEVNLALDASSFHGTVVDQSPAAGTMVEERSVVSVTVDDSEFKEPEDNGEAFIGTWNAERVSIQIMDIGSKFNVTITGSAGANESVMWSYNCDYSDGMLKSDKKGTKTTTTFDEDGNESNKTDYTNGSATFSLNGNTLTWNDNKEGAGNGFTFTRG